MKVKKNDTVLVLTGKDAGKTGKVIASNPADNKIKVDGVNVQLKSKKARSANETSAIVKQVGAIDASNVLVVCPACGKATRVAYKLEGDKKLRVCKKCGASLDVKKAAPVKTAAKKTATKKAADKAEGEEKKTTAKKTSTAKKTTAAKTTSTAKKTTAAKTTAAKKTTTKKAAAEKVTADKAE
ncbi:50S ribosomal protein L24 [Acidiphilium sp. CAG:727]|nr:50S ribosomal protein L24 [Acidiphilium sp. CAG:727]